MLMKSNASVDSTISEPHADKDIAKTESYVEEVTEKNAPSYNPKDDPNHPWVT